MNNTATTLQKMYPHLSDDVLEHYCDVEMNDLDWEYLAWKEEQAWEAAHQARLRKPSPWFDVAAGIVRKHAKEA